MDIVVVTDTRVMSIRGHRKRDNSDDHVHHASSQVHLGGQGYHYNNDHSGGHGHDHHDIAAWQSWET
jgi:hypothetical protein